MGVSLSITQIYYHSTIFNVNHPSSEEKVQKALCFLQKAIMERVPIPCSFSFDRGMPFGENATSAPQGLEISNISFGLQMHLKIIILCSSGKEQQDFIAFSSAFAMTMDNSPESTGSVSGKERYVSNVIPAFLARPK